MLDFSELLTTLADGVKKKPHQKPATEPLPSEVAIEEVKQGMSVDGHGAVRTDDTQLLAAPARPSSEMAQGEMPDMSTLVANAGVQTDHTTPTPRASTEGMREDGGHYYGSPTNNEMPTAGLKPAGVVVSQEDSPEKPYRWEGDMQDNQRWLEENTGSTFDKWLAKTSNNIGDEMFPGKGAQPLPTDDPVHQGMTTQEKYGQTPPTAGQDRYTRDSSGIPQRPAGAKGTDYVLRSDGTPSQYTWDAMDAMRKDVSTMSPEAAKALREGRLVEYNGQPITQNTPVQDNPKAKALVDPAKRTLDEQIAAGNEGVLNARNAPIKKQSFWKDFGAKLIQGADAFFNGNRAPIVGWGKLKHDQAVRTAEGKLNPLLAMKKQQQDVAIKDAQIVEIQDKPARARAALKQKIDAEKGRFDRQGIALEAQAKREGGKWKPYVDEQGRRWKQFTNDPNAEMEPIIDPTTREQDVDPNFKLYDWTDPTSNTTVQIKGSQLATTGATIAAGNAQRTQAADTTNANNEIEVAKENSKRINDWLNDTFMIEMDAYKQAATLGGDVGALQGVSGRMTQIAQELTANAQSEFPDTEKAEKLMEEFAKLQEKGDGLIGKTTAGTALLGKLQQARKPQPKLVPKPTKVAPSLVKSGSKVNESVFMERLKAQGVTDPAEQKALINKARADGIIK